MLGDLPLNFQAEPVSNDFTPLAKGRYRAQLTAIEVSHKDSGSVMLDLESEILDEQFKNRKVWTSINLVKKDGEINAIGNGQLSALAKACGKTEIPRDESTLLGIPHIVALTIETQPGYEPKNKMTGFYPIESEGKQILQQKVAEQGAFDAWDAEQAFNDNNETEEKLPL